MTNLSTLIHELRERIAASSSSSPSADITGPGEDPLETKFRTVLPNLLHAYVVPSSAAKEREVIAVLKLLSHTARNFPGVLFHGSAAAILPVLGRILPFLGEPAFGARHGAILDTILSLLTLLRSREREVYRTFFLDAMTTIEDIRCVMLIQEDSSSVQACEQVRLKCFCESFASISADPGLFSELPACCQPENGPGVLINLLGRSRWQQFAAWMVKLVTRCLTEGTLYVDGLLTVSFVSIACSLLCYGDQFLQIACFDFACAVATVKDVELVPSENIVRSITSILLEDNEDAVAFRNSNYDSSLGKCLQAIHSACQEDVIESTAHDILSVFCTSILSTESSILKEAMCNAYVRISKICLPHIWRPEIILGLLFSAKPCYPLIACVQMAIDLLEDPSLKGYGCSLNEICEDYRTSSVGQNKSSQQIRNDHFKRQKTEGNSVFSSEQIRARYDLICPSQCKQGKECARDLQHSLYAFIGYLKPENFKSSLSMAASASVALCMICFASYKHPKSCFSASVFKQMMSWIPWICKQAREIRSFPFDLSMYLEAVDCVLLLQGSFREMFVFFEDDNDDHYGKEDSTCVYPRLADLIELLKIPWSDHFIVEQDCLLQKIRCLCVQIFSKAGVKITSNFLEFLESAVHDKHVDVREEAVISMPTILFFSGHSLLMNMLKILESIFEDRRNHVSKMWLLSLGYLSCFQFDSADICTRSACPLKLFYGRPYENHLNSLDLLSKGFCCSKCDKFSMRNQDKHTISCLPHLESSANSFGTISVDMYNHFFEIILKVSSEELQVVCVQVMPRVLRHATKDALVKTRSKWLECFNYLLLHGKKAVRVAFCAEIGCFLEGKSLEYLFMDVEGKDMTQEQIFLEKMNHAIVETDDVEVLQTLLESLSEVMIVSNIRGWLFLHTLLLLVDYLDNPCILLRITASNLIRRSCYFHLKGGFELLLLKFCHIRDYLFEYLCAQLVRRPAMIQEFSEVLMGIKIERLVARMVPTILPKLLVSQKNDDQAIVIMHELAKHLGTELVSLVVNWLPKVLASALFHSDREVLSSILEFYHVETGSDSKELFAAALPALLDELMCFSGEDNMEEVRSRIIRIPNIVQEVAKVLTGSNDLPEFLGNHFVGLLNSIDRKMLHAGDLLLQKQALMCIEKLIEMMGSSLSTYVPKIMVLLMHAVDKEALQSEGLFVLIFFIKQLAKISPLSMKHIFSQVVAAFIPSLERSKEQPSPHLNKIVEILTELVIKNNLILKQQIRELPLLPDLQPLWEINKIIQEAKGTMTFRDQLQDAVNGLNHESLNVRYMVACELSKLLSSKRDEMFALVAGDSVLDLDVLSSLITALLRGCAEESRTSVGQRLKLVCADCLGALGAVDPAKFKGMTTQRFKIECSDDDLIFELIHNHLARAFRAASDTVVQDSAALAIQELLKLAGCQSNCVKKGLSLPTSFVTESSITSNRGQLLWNRFSNYVKEIIAPCLTSRFQLPTVIESTSSGPIYQLSMSFRRWIFLWIKKLTAHVTGTRFSIFSACRGIVRHDMQTALYLLPYLVLNALCHGTDEARYGITQEILSVLNAVASENRGLTLSRLAPRQSELCIQAVFTLLDNLGQWVDDFKQETTLSQFVHSSASKHALGGSCEFSPSIDSDLLVRCTNVSSLLSAIPKVTLARASFHCHAHARALMYYESYLLEKSGSFNPAAESSGIFADEDITYLMEIYTGLDEPDGLSGFAKLKRVSSLQDQLLINEKAGNWAEVLTSCEQALQMEPNSVPRHSEVLNCLLNMCHLQAMVTHVDGLICRIPEFSKTWCMQGVQAAWRLGRWDLMDEYLNGAENEGLVCSGTEMNASFDIGLAKIIQAMMKKDHFVAAERIAQSKQALLVPLAAAGMDSYMRAYPYVVKLHMLCEFEDFQVILGDEAFQSKSFNADDPKFSKLMKEWDNRLRFTQPSIWAREPLLAFRRLVFRANNMGSQVGDCWLRYAKLCRSSGHYETASRAILEAQASGAPNVRMEKAKLLWCTRKSDCAVAELQQSLLNMPSEILGASAISSLTNLSLVLPNAPSNICVTQASKDDPDVAKTILLYTRWIHNMGQKQKEDIINLYSRVRELQPTWEKAYFFMAKYCDDLLVDARKRQEDSLVGNRSSSASSSSCFNSSMEDKPWWSYLPDVLLFYAKGLHKGHRNLFQALPRLLTLWFEFGSMYRKDGPPSNRPLKAVHTRVLSIMRGCLKDLPTYQWLTVLSQLVSRICHQNEEIVRIVKHIITSVIQEYPQQALWMMAAVSKSTVSARRDAAAEIIQAARRGTRQGSSETSNLVVQFASLVDHLIKLCFHPGQSKARTINISTEFSALKRMMPLGIIMPIQQALTVTLPSFDSSHTGPLSFNVFSGTEHATISGITDEAEILSSLQRPKKVVFIGSDGIHRPFLCKPKDDLRKDARMMEFTATINRLLSKYPESRRRKLYIRTFAVIPFTEDCGMVEWVPHTRGLRQILQDIYLTCGKFDRHKTHPLIKRIYDQCQGKTPEDEMLKSKILPMFPPVFRKWFLMTFSEPASWFRARIAYAHTAAVWSMVGHIVGLGDRHGENILFDSTTGDTVHVDFSCLFDKGLQLEKPEVVPFRLTQNMIDGLGITGYEGVFLKVCEITLTVLRIHRETLMSVLETFVHDPLVEWTKSHKSSGVEVENPHAQRAISNIKARLQGVVVGVGAAPSLPLSVEGQATRLIAEAVSLKNLGKMYIWWMAWF